MIQYVHQYIKWAHWALIVHYILHCLLNKNILYWNLVNNVVLAGV